MASLSPAVGPDQLTEILREAGVLSRGRVTDVAIEGARETLISRITRLRLTFEDAGHAPLQVFIKTPREGADPQWRELGRKEIEFYRRIGAATPAGLLPRCFEAVIEDGAWRLMLEDLTTTHEPPSPDWPLPPPRHRVDAVVAAHARFHAHWWDDERLGTIAPFDDDSGRLDRWLRGAPAELQQFADRLGDRLSAARRRVYERLIADAPRLLSRYRTHRHLTLVHGDAHVWNALLARGAGDDTRLIDWDGWRIDMATADLAYMLALHCFPDWRRRFERLCLQRYHDVLVAAGVSGYDHDALWDDYRLSVLWQIITPMWQATHGIPAWIWWSHLERIFRAVEELDALALLT